jgi:LPXTG-motif cell wall-anchored protein
VNPSRLPVSIRAAAIVAAALLGALASLLISDPASAHFPTVVGNAVCDAATGTWKVTWQVSNSETDITGLLEGVKLTPEGSTVTNIAVGAVLPRKGDGALQGVQILPGSATSASLSVDAKWVRGQRIIRNHDSGDATFSGTCAAQPSAAFNSACDGSVTVTLANDAQATAAVDLTVTGEAGFTATKNVAAGGSEKVLVPAANAKKITVMSGQTKVAEGGFAAPASCATPGLPVTGASVTGAVITGVALIVVGAAALLLVRRRRPLPTRP